MDFGSKINKPFRINAGWLEWVSTNPLILILGNQSKKSSYPHVYSHIIIFIFYNIR
jgi:hypothetical protein